MPEPTIADVFPGATQTSSSITIPKAALTGLTAAADNAGDRITAGLVKRLIEYYTEARRTADPDVSITGELGRRSISTDFNQTPTVDYLEQEITLRFYSTLPEAEFDPDNF